MCFSFAEYNSIKNIQKQNRLAPQYDLLFTIKNLLDVHHFYYQSTLEMVTFMLLSVKCTKNLQTMQKQQPTSLFLRGK